MSRSSASRPPSLASDEVPDPAPGALVGKEATAPVVFREPFNPSIFIRHKDFFRKIDFDDILYIEASGSYLVIHRRDGHDLTLSFTLSEIVPRLDASRFVRVHRSFIVNIERVDAFIGNMLCLGEHRIPISRRMRDGVLALFNILGNPR